MKPLDYLLIAGIAAALIWAVRVCIRNRAQGKSCSGDCAHCGHSCGKQTGKPASPGKPE